MSSKQSIVDYLVNQVSSAGIVSAKKMFGEYAIYCNEKVVALVCDDRLFIKPTAEGKIFIDEYDEGLPYPGAKPWLLIPEEKWDEQEWLSQLIQITAMSLPLPKPKRLKKK